MNELIPIITALIPCWILWRYKAALDARKSLIADVNKILNDPRHSNFTRDFVCDTFKNCINLKFAFGFFWISLKYIFSLNRIFKNTSKKIKKQQEHLKRFGMNEGELEKVIVPHLRKAALVSFIRSPILYVFLGLAIAIFAVLVYLLISAAFALFVAISDPATTVSKVHANLNIKAGIQNHALSSWASAHQKK